MNANIENIVAVVVFATGIWYETNITAFCAIMLVVFRYAVLTRYKERASRMARDYTHKKYTSEYVRNTTPTKYTLDMSVWKFDQIYPGFEKYVANSGWI